MFFLNRILSILIFASCATTTCFPMETNAANLPMEKTDEPIKFIQIQKSPNLIFEKNGIKIEIIKTEEPTLSNFYKYKIDVKITNNTKSSINIFDQFFKIKFSLLSSVLIIGSAATLTILTLGLKSCFLHVNSAEIYENLNAIIITTSVSCGYVYFSTKDSRDTYFIQPNESKDLKTYISKSNFEKLEKGELTPELYIKKIDQ